MAVRPIIELGNPILRQASRPVKEEELKEVKDLALDMLDTLQDFKTRMGFGRGIAAPQVGVNKRVVVLQYEGMTYTLINPRIKESSDEKFAVWDSCFSYPGIWFQVKRHRQVKVEYRDLNWEFRTLEGQDELAELIQHELEHLDGFVAIDKADPKTFCTTNEYFSRYWEDGSEDIEA